MWELATQLSPGGQIEHSATGSVPTPTQVMTIEPHPSSSFANEPSESAGQAGSPFTSSRGTLANSLRNSVGLTACVGDRLR